VNLAKWSGKTPANDEVRNIIRLIASDLSIYIRRRGNLPADLVE
jgi:hypothetical protein